MRDTPNRGRGWDWRIVYPCGDRAKLDVAYVRVHQSDDWDIASSLCFDTEQEAWDYMVQLATKKGLHHPRQFLD